MSYYPASGSQNGNDLQAHCSLSRRARPTTLGQMNARAALFDLYGDHLRPRGGRVSVAALVRLLAPLEIASPAVRTAVSRMVRQGWLTPIRLTHPPGPPLPGYALTPKAVRRLDEAALRIYRVDAVKWDGRWHLVVVDPIR